MSQQDNPQDSQELPPVSDSGTWSETPASNRPAEGATRVASLHQAEQTWSAGEGATDFLGLEQENPAEAPSLAPTAAADAAGEPEVNPTQAWLFHMESEANGSLVEEAPAHAPGEVPAPEWSAESLLEAPDPVPSLEAAASLEGEPLSDVMLAPISDAPQESAQPVRRRKTQWLVAAGLVTALLAAGGWQIWNSKSKPEVKSDPLAWRSGHKPTKPKPTTTETPTETPTVAVKPPVETPTVAEQPPVEQPPVELPVQPLPTPTEVAVSNPPVADPVAVEPTPAPDEPVAQVSTQPDLTPVPFSGTRPEDPVAGLATPKGARRPDPAEIAGLWTVSEIPYDAIGADTMLRTPRVGAVRVLLKNGEHLQGRLHSVGQGHVSMDVSLGRMSVDYSDVREMVQILEADLSKKPSNGLPDETAGLMYVTAKVPGGYITGWLVQRTGGKLTLITEQAKKITFEDDGFEPVSKGRARVVGSLSGDDGAVSGPVPAASTPATKAPAKQASGKPAAKSAAKPKH